MTERLRRSEAQLFSVSPFIGHYSTHRFALDQVDAFEWLRHQPSESIDLIITDPPYESLEKHRAKGTTTRLKQSKASSNEWFGVIKNERFPELMGQLYRVLKRDRHCYVFCDQETMFHLKPAGEAAGFKFWKPIVWHKKRVGMGYHYRSAYELILFFEKGKRKLYDLGMTDVREHLSIRGGYPAEKPPAVSRDLIAQSSRPGELVADPFMGSGSVGVAALHQGCRFIGDDIARTAFELATERLLGVP